MLIHLLKEVERELRGFDKEFAANLVRIAASAVATDVDHPPDKGRTVQNLWIM